MTATKVGIVGYGFVGRATAFLLQNVAQIFVYDKNPDALKNCERYGETPVASIDGLHDCDIIFVCVPTPMQQNGECDTSIVESAVKDSINHTCATVVIRSTVPPGFTDKMCRLAREDADIVFCPEFLTEVYWKQDVHNATRVVVGGKDPSASHVAMLFYKAYQRLDRQPSILTMTSTEAEIGKLMTNGLLAAKVSFCNEVYALAKGLGANYNAARGVATSDPRIGPSHTKVLGPDGKRGFGGTCLPKDLWNLRWAISAFMDPLVMDATLKSNELVRPERDWEKLVGRAVTAADKENP